MDIEIIDVNLTAKEKKDIRILLDRQSKSINNDIEQIWHLLDLVWDDNKCDNKKLNWKNIGKFYSHPAWLLNGLLTEEDETSMGRRHAISNWIIKNTFMNVVDYGGGFGTLARLVAQKNKNLQMSIYEPHPSEFGLKRASEFENIKIITKLENRYDCLMSMDVLEHVPDPLKDFADMINSVKLNGYLVVANAFYPMVKCHLPQNFHFRYTFNQFAKMMGLEVIGILDGSHATIFKKVVEIEPKWNKIRLLEKLSKLAFPLVEVLRPILGPIKSLLFK